MKKLMALLMAGVLAATSCTAAFAAEAADAEEEILELNWSDVEAAVKESGMEGDFVSFDEVAIKMWLPSVLEATELTDEDKEAGYIGYYQTADESAAVAVMYVDMDGMELDEYAELLAEDESIEDIEAGIINGLACISYSQPENDSTSLSFASDSGYILEVTFAPLSDEEFGAVAALISCSIMPEE